MKPLEWKINHFLSFNINQLAAIPDRDTGIIGSVGKLSFGTVSTVTICFVVEI
jgi:hypothetical protein